MKSLLEVISAQIEKNGGPTATYHYLILENSPVTKKIKAAQYYFKRADLLWSRDRRPRWSPKEIELLINNNHLTLPQLCKIIKTRSKWAVENQRIKMRSILNTTGTEKLSA